MSNDHKKNSDKVLINYRIRESIVMRILAFLFVFGLVSCGPKPEVNKNAGRNKLICLTKCGPVNPIYSINDGRVYYGTVLIENADADSFEDLGNEYAKDKDRVYYMSSVLEGADSASFAVLDDGSAKDQNRTYLNGKVVTDSDAVDI